MGILSLLSQKILSIIQQSVAGSPLVNELVLLRDNTTRSLSNFNGGGKSCVKQRSIFEMIPDHVVITNYDKDVGVSVLPHDWFRKEYEAQIEKGKYTLVSMTESQCLSFLHKKSEEFLNKCTEKQRSLVRKLLPHVPKESFKLGILHLLPKVNTILVYIFRIQTFCSKFELFSKKL